MFRYLLPLAAFLGLVALLAAGLKLNPREVPSPLIDRPVPAFSLSPLDAPERRVSAADLRGQVWLLNVWASWCASCQEEHPVLLEYARRGGIPLLGLDWKDKPEDALAWLKRNGNPYSVALLDLDGRVGLDFGVYGVPETYLIDREGVIRFKQIGPLTPEVLAQKVAPLIVRYRGG